LPVSEAQSPVACYCIPIHARGFHLLPGELHVPPSRLVTTRVTSRVTSRLVNRNIVAGGGRTSMRLEPELWDAVLEICRREGISLGDLVRGAEQIRTGPSGRTSAVRVFAMNYFRAAATEAGHLAAGHRGLGGEPNGVNPATSGARNGA